MYLCCMRMTGRYILAWFALLVYCGSVSGFLHDSFSPRTYAFGDEQSVPIFAKLNTVKYYHLLPDGNALSSLTSGFQHQSSTGSLAELIDFEDKRQTVYSQYFLASSHQSFGLTTRDIIYPFHFYW